MSQYLSNSVVHVESNLEMHVQDLPLLILATDRCQLTRKIGNSNRPSSTSSYSLKAHNNADCINLLSTTLARATRAVMDRSTRRLQCKLYISLKNRTVGEGDFTACHGRGDR